MDYLREIRDDDEKFFRITALMTKHEGKKDVKVAEMRDSMRVIITRLVEEDCAWQWTTPDAGPRYMDWRDEKLSCRVCFYSKIRDKKEFDAPYGLSFTFRKR
jgi:hypothetical protein